MGDTQLNELLRYVFLSTIDQLWMEHIDALDELRMGIGLRGYGQREPLVEFKNESYRMFEALITSIDFEIVNRFLKIKVETPEQAQMRQQQNILQNAQAKHQEVNTFQGNTQQVSQQINQPAPQVTIKKSEELKELSRNDPCPCGSGKKWKHCHYPNLP